MTRESLATVLEREHHEIDDGIATFTSSLALGRHELEPLTRAVHALRRHIYLEEELLFPALRNDGLIAPILVMVREHGQLWATLDQLERDLSDALDDDTVAKRCRELVVQLQHHNSKEERIVYPQADQALSASEAIKLEAFLGSGQFPEGWICEKARPASGQQTASGVGIAANPA